MHEKELNFELKNVISPYDGKYYIGFVCDVINNYFRLKSKTYLISIAEGNISNSSSAILLLSKNKRVKLVRCEEEKYLVIGLPHKEKFENFKKAAQSKLEKLLENIKKEGQQRFT